MNRKTSLFLIIVIMLWTQAAIAGDSDSDSERRTIRAPLSAFALERDALLIDRESFIQGRAIRAQLLALVETYSRIGDDSDVDLEAWDIGAGAWEIRSLSFNRRLLDEWDLEVPTDELRDATPAQVMIDGNLYLWELEIYERMQQYVWAANCVVTFLGWTRVATNAPEFHLRDARLSAGCRPRDDD